MKNDRGGPIFNLLIQFVTLARSQYLSDRSA
jgi:hypothetical protein